jgi:hypothetical protein
MPSFSDFQNFCALTPIFPPGFDRKRTLKRGWLSLQRWHKLEPHPRHTTPAEPRCRHAVV